MKSLGIVRKIDELGRIVLPIETRKAMNILAGDGIELFVDQDRIILKKYQPSCIFCGDADDNIMFGGKTLCKNCVAKLQKLEI